MSKRLLVLALILWGTNIARCEKADLVLRNGRLATVDREKPHAAALAIRGDRIIAVGSDKDVSSYIGEKTNVVDLKGKFAMPGFIEGHGHFAGLGYSKLMLDLTKAKSWEDIVKQVAEAAKKEPAGTWIEGRGWHQAKWNAPPSPNVDGYPVHKRLSDVTPRHPVMLTHASGHMSFANAEAMRLAGVTARTRNPAGGEILHDDKKQPIGVFRETAQSLIGRARERTRRQLTVEQSRARFFKAIELAGEECLRKGVTSFQDAGSSFNTIGFYRRMAEQSKLPLRLWVMVRESNSALARNLPRYRMIGRGNHHLTVRAIKRSIDGALGAHGAWLLEPYDDLPSSTGLNTSTVNSIRRTAQLALQHDYQLCVHAIGDRANRATLDIFEAALGAKSRAKRWRVEHAQHLNATDIPRFGKLGIIASMQGIHCTSDAVFVMQRLGQRRAATGAYVWRSLLDTGATIVNGTDVPVEDVDPLASFYASVTRRLKNGTTFYPEQCMTREEALRSYTLDAAVGAYEEQLKGSLSVGKLADVVVLSHDLLKCADAELLKARVEMTILAGKVRYTAKVRESP